MRIISYIRFYLYLRYVRAIFCDISVYENIICFSFASKRVFSFVLFFGIAMTILVVKYRLVKHCAHRTPLCKFVSLPTNQHLI